MDILGEVWQSFETLSLNKEWAYITIDGAAHVAIKTWC